MFILKFFYKLIVIIYVILKNLVMLIFKKLTSFKHRFEFLYYKKLKNKKYMIIYYCKKCNIHKQIIINKNDFIKLKNKSFKYDEETKKLFKLIKN